MFIAGVYLRDRVLKGLMFAAQMVKISLIKFMSSLNSVALMLFMALDMIILLIVTPAVFKSVVYNVRRMEKVSVYKSVVS